jgi:hypothetical protein
VHESLRLEIKLSRPFFEHEHNEAAGGDGGAAHAMEERFREKVPGV